MRKLKNILLSLLMISVVVLSTACSSKGSNPTKTFELEKDGMKTTITYTYIESEDKVIKQNTVVEGEYAKLKPARTKEEFQKIVGPIAEKYQGIQGIKESTDYQDEKFVENIEIDYENLDYEKSKTVLGNNFQDPAKVKISMKKTEEGLTKQGYTEKK